MRAAASHHAIQARLCAYQLDAAESPQEQNALRLHVGELCRDIDARCASQRKQNGGGNPVSDCGAQFAEMWDDVAKSGIAIVPSEMKAVAVGDNVRTVGDKEN